MECEKGKILEESRKGDVDWIWSKHTVRNSQNLKKGHIQKLKIQKMTLRNCGQGVLLFKVK